MQKLTSAALLLMGVLSGLASTLVMAETISVESLAQIQVKHQRHSWQASLNNPTVYFEENNHSLEERIYLRVLMLNRLALVREPTTEQREWIKAQHQNTDTLSVRSIEHNDQLTVVAHVANAANMVDMHWQAYSKQKEYKQSWEAGTWLWKTYFRDQSRVTQMAMTFWLDELSDSNVQLFAESYLEEGIQHDLDSNRQLSLLIGRTQSTDLLSALWQRPSDAYSHRVLNSIINEGENIDDIIKATQNPKLSSQALLSLVKNHSDVSRVQSFLREAIESKQLSSATLGVLGLLGDDRFRRQLVAQYQQRPVTALTRRVLKQLGGEIE